MNKRCSGLFFLMIACMLLASSAYAQSEFLDKGTSGFAVLGGTGVTDHAFMLNLSAGFGIKGSFDIGANFTTLFFVGSQADRYPPTSNDNSSYTAFGPYVNYYLIKQGGPKHRSFSTSLSTRLDIPTGNDPRIRILTIGLRILKSIRLGSRATAVPQVGVAMVKPLYTGYDPKAALQFALPIGLGSGGRSRLVFWPSMSFSDHRQTIGISIGPFSALGFVRRELNEGM